MAQAWFRRPVTSNRMLADKWEPVPDDAVPFIALVTNKARVTFLGKRIVVNVGHFNGDQWIRIELDEFGLLQAHAAYHLNKPGA